MNNDQIKKELQRARDLEAEAEDMKDKAYEMFKEAAEIERLALETITPFKKGDVIEYQTKVGWRDGGKIVKRRLVADSISYDYTYQGICVTGAVSNAKCERSWRNRDSAVLFSDKRQEKFIRVLGQVKS